MSRFCLPDETRTFYGRGTTASITVIGSPPFAPTRDWVMIVDREVLIATVSGSTAPLEVRNIARLVSGYA
ncbi:hypothetical protein [Sphingomonas sp. R86520]|uniref:hypothetical protein n=1 Tax=Sphingomonas sp. R86520 TaxID=3093859 RepID=UPI0036D27723